MSGKSTSPIPAVVNETSEAMLSLTQAFLTGTQNIVDLNFSTLRKILDNEASCLNALVQVSDLKEANDLQMTLARTLAETAMSYSKEAWQLNLQNTEAFAGLLRSNQELLRQSGKNPWQGLTVLSGLDFFRNLAERK